VRFRIIDSKGWFPALNSRGWVSKPAPSETSHKLGIGASRVVENRAYRLPGVNYSVVQEPNLPIWKSRGLDSRLCLSCRFGRNSEKREPPRLRRARERFSFGGHGRIGWKGPNPILSRGARSGKRLGGNATEPAENVGQGPRIPRPSLISCPAFSDDFQPGRRFFGLRASIARENGSSRGRMIPWPSCSSRGAARKKHARRCRREGA